MNNHFADPLRSLREGHDSLITRTNSVDSAWDNGIYERYQHPVLTPARVPLEGHYDLDHADQYYRTFLPSARNDRAEIREIEPDVPCSSLSDGTTIQGILG